MDDFDLAAGYESDADALAAFEGELLAVSFTGDWHFTVEQSEALADACRTAGVDVAHHVVESDHGHDAFLVEPEGRPAAFGPPRDRSRGPIDHRHRRRIRRRRRVRSGSLESLLRLSLGVHESDSDTVREENVTAKPCVRAHLPLAPTDRPACEPRA